MNHVQEALLTHISDAITELNHYPTTGDDLPDVAGHIRHYETRLAAQRRDLTVEAGEYQTGRKYKMLTTRKNLRSYNQAAIFRATQAAGISFMDLVAADVIRIDWQWSKLKNLFAEHDLELRVVSHELGARGAEETGPDGPHVGAYKDAPYTRPVGLTEDELAKQAEAF